MEPRYLTLTRTLLNDISTGVYPIGSSLPGELELAERHGVSRGTVRAALDRIQTLGLISRRKRAGTRVESNTPRNTEYGPTISTIDELVHYGARADRVIHDLRLVVVDLALSKRLGCEPDTTWMRIQTTRHDPLISDRPLAWIEVFVRAEDGEKIRPLLKDKNRLICDLVCEITGSAVKNIRQLVSAIGVPTALAKRLDSAPDAHALEFVRQYYDMDDRLIETTISIHPSDRFSYTTMLQRQGAEPA